MKLKSLPSAVLALLSSPILAQDPQSVILNLLRPYDTGVTATNLQYAGIIGVA